MRSLTSRASRFLFSWRTAGAHTSKLRQSGADLVSNATIIMSVRSRVEEGGNVVASIVSARCHRHTVPNSPRRITFSFARCRLASCRLVVCVCVCVREGGSRVFKTCRSGARPHARPSQVEKSKAGAASASIRKIALLAMGRGNSPPSKWGEHGASTGPGRSSELEVKSENV